MHGEGVLSARCTAQELQCNPGSRSGQTLGGPSGNIGQGAMAIVAALATANLQLADSIVADWVRIPPLRH